MAKKRIKKMEVDTSLGNVISMVETTVEVEEPKVIEEPINESIEEFGSIEREKEDIQDPEVEKVDEEEVVIEKEVVEELELPKKQYILCPFCDMKMYVQHGSDAGSSWCERCGKCFEINFHEE